MLDYPGFLLELILATYTFSVWGNSFNTDMSAVSRPDPMFITMLSVSCPPKVLRNLNDNVRHCFKWVYFKYVGIVYRLPSQSEDLIGECPQIPSAFLQGRFGPGSC